mgnify:CR=1 FL=1
MKLSKKLKMFEDAFEATGGIMVDGFYDMISPRAYESVLMVSINVDTIESKILFVKRVKEELVLDLLRDKSISMWFFATSTDVSQNKALPCPLHRHLHM